MRTLIAMTALAATILAGSARAAEFQSLRGKVAKYAGLVAVKSGGPCVCQDGGALHGKVGYLAATTFSLPGGQQEIVVWCMTELFTNEGAYLSNQSCFDFLALAK